MWYYFVCTKIYKLLGARKSIRVKISYYRSYELGHNLARMRKIISLLSADLFLQMEDFCWFCTMTNLRKSIPVKGDPQYRVILFISIISNERKYLVSLFMCHVDGFFRLFQCGPWCYFINSGQSPRPKVHKMRKKSQRNIENNLDENPKKIERKMNRRASIRRWKKNTNESDITQIY